MQDEPRELVMTALAMASAMVRTYHENALGAVRRHIARCLEENLIEDVEFWLQVRNQVEILQWDEIRAEGARKRSSAGGVRPGEELVMEAWLKDVLRRMAGSVLEEPMPDELMRLVGPPLPEDEED